MVLREGGSTLETLNQIIILFSVLMVGYLCKRLKVISNDMNRDMSNLIIYVSLPALIISSLSGYDFSKQILTEISKLLIISFSVYVLSIIISYIFPRVLGVKGTTRDIFQFMIVFANVGFMGYPVVHAILGSKGVFYAAIYNMFFDVFVWTFGVMVLSRPLREGKNGNSDAGSIIGLKQLMNPPIIAVCIGFFMFLTSTTLPNPVHKVLNILGSITTPLSMIFIGSMLADLEIRKSFTNTKMLLGSLIRLVVLPLIVLGTLKLLDFDGLMISIPVIITAMPVAASLPILAARYDNDYYLAAQSVFISTLLCIVTIPLIVSIL